MRVLKSLIRTASSIYEVWDEEIHGIKQTLMVDDCSWLIDQATMEFRQEYHATIELDNILY